MGGRRCFLQWNNIVLVGLMGTGKSTVGMALADKMGWKLINTDDYIEEKAGKKITELFSEYGEVHFRERESAAIKEIMDQGEQVVSTGGGAVLAEVNRVRMLENGYVIALTASLATILQRVGGDQNRPLLQGNKEERVRTLMEDRKHAYDFAHLQVATDGLTVEQIVESITEQMKKAAR
jgi:shikimate kinase